MTKRDILNSLIEQIPTFKCIPGCTDCCGPVPISKLEMEDVYAHYKIKRGKLRSELHCPYECKEGCAIYEHRPLICRLFGTANDDKLKCPHGFMPETVLSVAQASVITDIYKREFASYWIW